MQVSPNVVQGVLRKGYKQPRDPLGNAAWRAGVGCSAERREGADFVRGRSSDAAAAGVDMDAVDLELIAEWIVNAGPGASGNEMWDETAGGGDGRTADGGEQARTTRYGRAF